MILVLVRQDEGLFLIQLCFLCYFFSGLKVELRSEGCDDPKLVPVHCGRAYIKVNGNDYAVKRRGHNLVVVDLQTGKFFKKFGTSC